MALLLKTLHKNDTYSVTACVNFGYMTPDDFRKLADIADKFGVTEIMTTTQKRLNMMDVKEENVAPLWDALQDTFGDKLVTAHAKIEACPGNKYCKRSAAIANNLEVARKIEALTLHYGEEMKNLKIGVSGCSHTCAYSKVKDIGVFATVKGWYVMVGGNGGTKPGVGEIIGSNLSEEEMLQLVDKVLNFIQTNRRGTERCLRLVERLGMDTLKAAVLGETEQN